MEQYSSTELGPDKSMQLKEIDRAMAAEKHQQDKEQKMLTDEVDENRHRRYVEEENTKRETILLGQKETMRIREHEEKMAAENHNREMDKLKERHKLKVLEDEMLHEENSRVREHEVRMAELKAEEMKKSEAKRQRGEDFYIIGLAFSNVAVIISTYFVLPGVAAVAECVAAVTPAVRAIINLRDTERLPS